MHATDEPDAPHVAKADAVVGLDRLRGRRLPRRRRRAAAPPRRAVRTRCTPATASSREPAVRAGLRRARPHLRRPVPPGAVRRSATRPAPASSPPRPGSPCSPPADPAGASALLERVGAVMVKAVAGGGGRGMRRVPGPRPRSPTPWRALRVRGGRRVRRRPGLRRGAAAPGPPRRGADPRRRHRRGHPARRPRLLGAAPPPEGRRGRAGSRARPRRARRAARRGGATGRVRALRAAWAPSSSSCAATGSRSSRSTPGCRSSTRSPRRSPGSTSCRRSSGSRTGRPSPSSGSPRTRPRAPRGSALQARITLEHTDADGVHHPGRRHAHRLRAAVRAGHPRRRGRLRRLPDEPALRPAAGEADRVRPVVRRRRTRGARPGAR